MADSLARVAPALNAVEAVLQRISEHGLQRATPATRAELTAVAQQAHHARLIRLERELEALVTHLGRYLDRDPVFRPAQWVSGATRAWLLVGATRRALATATVPLDLEAVAGTPRRRYVAQDGQVDVHAVAASGWVTDTGYVGLSVHLWRPDTGRWLSAAVVRPETLVGPSPIRLLRYPVSEAFPLSTQALAHGSWTLDDVRLSSDGRISLHRGLVAVPAAPMGRAALQPLFVATAADAVERLANTEIDAVSGVGSTLVYLEPVAVVGVEVDETQARATAGLRDATGATILVRVPLKPENDLLIDNLEALATPRWQPDGLVARASLFEGQLALSPLTAIYRDPVKLKGARLEPVHEVHLTLEPLEGAER